jgi:hypothetical protein
VLPAHQGGGEPLRSMPLEITRCLRVPGAEITQWPSLPQLWQVSSRVGFWLPTVPPWLL